MIRQAKRQSKKTIDIGDGLAGQTKQSSRALRGAQTYNFFYNEEFDPGSG